MGSGGKGGKGGGAEITQYNMSMHMGLCHGGDDVDLLGIFMGEKEAWYGVESDPADILIDKPALFGGDKKEGGAVGTVRWLPGKEDQTLPEFLAQKLGLTTATCPGFRGIASLFFTGNSNNAGFYLSANNPYLKDVWARLRRIPIGLNPDYAKIRLADDSEGREQYAVNPAHMIYEAQTNSTWGEGAPAEAFDFQSYEDAAKTLYEEDFGLAVKWMRQAPVGDFVGEIIDHIRAVQFDSSRTGLRTLKLLRGDYDLETLRTIDPNNAKLTNFQRKLWGESANEIVVTWTNPETEKPQTVTAQDLAAIASQGEPISSSANYYMVRSEELAFKLAERDLAASVQPIASCDVDVDRANWDLEPGEVVFLHWPEKMIERIAMRVMEVDKGKPTDVNIKVNLLEDIFGLDTASYTIGSSSLWVNESANPIAPDNVYFGTAPALMSAGVLGLNDVTELEDPDAVAIALVGKNGSDYLSYDLTSPVTMINGSIEDKTVDTRSFWPRFELIAPLAQETESLIENFSTEFGETPSVGDFVFFQGVDDASSEIAIVSAVTGSDVTVDRGILDTTPLQWEVGNPVWFWKESVAPGDPTTRFVSEEIDYRVLTSTSKGRMDLSDARTDTVTLTDRAYLPLRPANVAIDGVSYGTRTLPPATLSFTVTWSNRNRLIEASQVLFWDDADVTPEVGQTTSVIVMQTDRQIVYRLDGLAGSQVTINVADLPVSPATYIVKIISIRSAKESIQGHEITLVVE